MKTTILRKLLGVACFLYLLSWLLGSAFVLFLVARNFLDWSGGGTSFKQHMQGILMVVLPLYWLFTAFVRQSPNMTVVLFCMALGISLWLLATFANPRQQTDTVVWAGFVALGFWASWYIRNASTLRSPPERVEE